MVGRRFIPLGEGEDGYFYLEGIGGKIPVGMRFSAQRVDTIGMGINEYCSNPNNLPDKIKETLKRAYGPEILQNDGILKHVNSFVIGDNLGGTAYNINYTKIPSNTYQQFLNAQRQTNVIEEDFFPEADFGKGPPIEQGPIFEEKDKKA